MTDRVLQLANRHSRPKRLALIAIGLVVAVWPIWDLWRGIASVSLVAPVFWIIGLGAVTVGGVLVSGSIFGWSTVLTISPEGLWLEQENLLQRRVTPVAAAELGAVEVVEQEWSDGPMTWRVSLARTGGKPLMSEGFSTRAGAEDLARRIAAALSRQPG